MLKDLQPNIEFYCNNILVKNLKVDHFSDTIFLALKYVFDLLCSLENVV